MIIIHSMSSLVYIYLLILCDNYSKILNLIDLRNFDKVFGKSRESQACKILDRNVLFVFHIIVALQTFQVELVVYSSAYPTFLEISLIINNIKAET